MSSKFSDMDDTWIGLYCCLFSGLMFGSMFVPLKNYKLRDGFFVQWVQCAIIFVFGLVVNFARSQPRFEPGSAIAGLISATGNILRIPIVNVFGPGLSMLIWGSVQITVGWATARFGLFGLREQIPANIFMNYAGVALTLVSGSMFALVKRNSNSPSKNVWTSDLPEKSDDIQNQYSVTHSKYKEQNSISGNRNTDILYVCIAVIAGIFFGQMLTPVVYVQDNVIGASQEGLDYVFSYFCGMFAGSTIYFIIYCIVKKNRPFVNSEIILPFVAYGLMWAFAMTAWFVSNKLLSQAISFPIVTRIPGVIAACWDVFYFKTIKGKRNLIFLTAAVSVGLIGVILVGLSK